jgi:spermidine synthase
MDRWTELARTSTAAGDELVLRERAGTVELRCNGWELMSNRAHHSESALAELACDAAATIPQRLLIAGLGFGYTLRAALDRLPQSARVTVAELLPDVIAWNHGPLAPLAGHPLADPRVSIVCTDISELLRTADPGNFDAILLDTDNGPDSVMLTGNASLYTQESLWTVARALRPAGILAVWSSDPSPRFEHNLHAAGFRWSAHHVPARGGADDPVHTIYLARAPA